mmetsp:Transcript_2572/g.5991  ORF Transcript_2572/g.5991 Transcript_2572/m.5991 type:complete len:310 (-) Transcript_2572:932-1861(-)
MVVAVAGKDTGISPAAAPRRRRLRRRLRRRPHHKRRKGNQKATSGRRPIRPFQDVGPHRQPVQEVTGSRVIWVAEVGSHALHEPTTPPIDSEVVLDLALQVRRIFGKRNPFDDSVVVVVVVVVIVLGSRCYNPIVHGRSQHLVDARGISQVRQSRKENQQILEAFELFHPSKASLRDRIVLVRPLLGDVVVVVVVVVVALALSQEFENGIVRQMELAECPSQSTETLSNGLGAFLLDFGFVLLLVNGASMTRHTLGMDVNPWKLVDLVARHGQSLQTRKSIRDDFEQQSSEIGRCQTASVQFQDRDVGF